MKRAEGKVAIVTGAASGLGAASATALHREGASVVIADIAAEAGEKLAQELGERALFLPLDVREESAWPAVISKTVKHFGKLDVLVNNAGVVVVASIEETTYEQLKFIQSVNFDGPFLGCKHAIPAMVASGGGSIVNLSSTSSMVGTPPFAAYSATKGAVRALTQTVAVHCKQLDNGVRCNSIHPGGMDTPMVASLLELAAQAPQAIELMGRIDPNEAVGHPHDVAAAVVYLATDESRFVNGALLAVDNGLTAS